MDSNSTNRQRIDNQGFSLAIILILTAVLSMMGVGMLKSSLLHEQIIQSHSHSQIALSRAQSAAALVKESGLLHNVESQIREAGYHDTFEYPEESPIWATGNFDDRNAATDEWISIAVPQTTGSSKDARVFIERLYQSNIHDALNQRIQNNSEKHYIRATIKAKEGTSIAVIQVVYKLTYPKPPPGQNLPSDPDDITRVSWIQIR